MIGYLSPALFTLGIFSSVTFAAEPVSPLLKSCEHPVGTSAQEICDASKKETAKEFPAMIKKIINTMLFVAGIIAVIMIIVGGIRYTVSNGESAQIKTAKDTITYSVIGLV